MKIPATPNADPHAARDFQALTQQASNTLLSQAQQGEQCVQVLQRR